MKKSKKIIYIQYTNPGCYPPLEHSSRLFASRCWEVLFLGTGCLGANRLVLEPNPNIRVRTMPFCRPGLLQKMHYLIFTAWVIGLTLLKRPRWVYASDSFSCLPGVVLTFLGFKVIYHEHDAPNGNEEGEGRTWWLAMVFAMRRYLGRRAELVIMPNNERLGVFNQQVERKGQSLCVWNCPEVREVRSPCSPSLNEPLRMLYHGSIGPSRLPFTVLEALSQSGSSIKLRIVGYETVGHNGYTAALLHRAKMLNVLHQIEIKEAVPTRKELLDLCSECDFGLALMPMKSNDINMRYMAGASNKPFDYLACGLPLLVSDLPDWNEMYVLPGYGRACNPDDPDSIGYALRWFLTHPQQRQAMGEKGRQKIISEWNYEKQFESVLKTVDCDITILNRQT